MPKPLDHRARQREHDAKRSQNESRHWYWSARWRRASKRFLRQNPLCCYCEREGRVTAATIVDHRIPHRGNPTLFWDEGNWQSMCKPHHDSDKQREERGRFQTVGEDGWPI